MLSLWLTALMPLHLAAAKDCIMYLTGQHNVVPSLDLVSDVNVVNLAFMRSEVFNQDGHEADRTWPLFTTVESARSKFVEGTAVIVAIGGWGDTAGFEIAAASEESRKLFAKNVKAMLEATGADGVDVDWEYPGGNGEDYKTNPNSKKEWQIDAYPLLLSEIRRALGPSKIISAAVPGLPRDMMAFTKQTIPEILASVDYFNVMTYDLMNRRDNVTKHHSGVQLSLEAIDAYESNGIPPGKMNLGYAFYVKWFKTASNGGCKQNPVGCKTALMEDPETGADLGQSGAFSWHDPVPSDVRVSFRKALAGGTYDEVGGGQYYWDAGENIWWTWEAHDTIWKKFPAIVEQKKLRGVFAWGLGEDADGFLHLKALTAALETADSGIKMDPALQEL